MNWCVKLLTQDESIRCILVQIGTSHPCRHPSQVRRLVDAINEASGIIPGWDEYAETGVAKALWDGKTFAS